MSLKVWGSVCRDASEASPAGIFQLANVLRENTYGSIAISILFAVAALTHWQAGAGWLSAHLGERISQVSAHAARGQAWSIPAAGAVCSGQAGWVRT